MSTIGGQATQGNGVPLIWQRSNNASVAVTTLVGIINVNAPVTGFYRAGIAITFGNGTAEAITAAALWTDPNNSAAGTGFFMDSNLGTRLNGSETPIVSGRTIGCYDITFYAKAATAIHINYQDPGGTPADFVTAYVELLA